MSRGSRSLASDRKGSAAYVEVVMDAYVALPLAIKVHESVKTLY
jgi:hypothetical protein